MGHLGQSTYCSGSPQGPRKAIEISTVNLHYWLPVSLLLWKPIIGNCHIIEQFMEVLGLCMPQWELPLTGVFHQPRSAYLFTQWDKSIRNLNTSSLKCRWDSHSKVLHIVHFLAFPVIHLHGYIQSTSGLSCLYFFSSSTGTFLHLFCVPLLLWGYGRQNAAALGWVHLTIPVSTTSKGLAKISSYSYGPYLVTPGKLASTLISKSDLKCIKIWLQPRTTASPPASTILVKSPTQNHPVLPLQSRFGVKVRSGNRWWRHIPGNF